jgi:hypothetical protein
MGRRTTQPTPAPMLISRRRLLQAGACAAVTPLVAGAVVHWHPAAPLISGRASEIPVHRVVFDRDHPAAVVFGRAGHEAGLPVEPIGADLTALWRDLSLRWRRQPVGMAGLTTEPAALYLQLLAYDAGLRVVLRASHTPLKDGHVRHYVAGPRTVLQEMSLLDSGNGWAVGALALVCRCPPDLTSKITMTRVFQSSGAVAFPHQLVSWVIAPVARSQEEAVHA